MNQLSDNINTKGERLSSLEFILDSLPVFAYALPTPSHRGYFTLWLKIWGCVTPSPGFFMKTTEVISKYVCAIALACALFGCNRKSIDEKSTVTFGAILPLTGSASELAVQHRRGLELGIKYINSTGGVNGRKILLAVEDDQNDSKSTINALQKLVSQDKISAFVTVMSGPSMAVAPVSDKLMVPQFANCGHPLVTTAHKLVFRNFPSSGLEVRKMAGFGVDTLKLKTIWLLYIDDAYGQGAKDLVVKVFPEKGIQVLGSDGYGKEGVDMRPALLRISSAAPEAIYVYGYGKATADAVNQIREVGYKGTLLGSYNFSQPPLTTVSKAALSGSYYTVPKFDYEQSEMGKDFLSAYRSEYQSDPLWNVAVEYDAVMILAQALKLANQQSVDLREALTRVGKFNGVAGAYEYDKTAKEWLTPMRIAHVNNDNVEYLK